MAEWVIILDGYEKWKQPNCSQVSKAHAFSYSHVLYVCVLSAKPIC